MTSDFFEKYMKCETAAAADPSQIITRGDVRFSVLTDRLLRVEWDEDAHFTDEPTQSVWFRNFDKPVFETSESGNLIEIRTESTIYVYDLKVHKMHTVKLADGRVITDFHKGNLRGTARTLDNTYGKKKLEEGLISLRGVSVFDDTKSNLISEDGSVIERKATNRDEYYFAYGQDYRGCIRSLYELCGKSPLVPRYCLGNWWSRYKAYSQEEYISLMKQFLERKIPITVATIDMDWHWVDVERFGADAKFQFPRNCMEKYVWSDGWTGYSWNTELFPDYKGFLKWLKEQNFKITLNVHPSQGVRPFENQYTEFAERIGMNPAEKKHIPFNITDKKFIEAYFDILHRPFEEDGVDFWWLDWQQGTETDIRNLDPLWALNHYHYLYAKRNQKRPLILSRYAQMGSHRYPLGFSGDTAVNWKVLRFQPYFTANAANVGYTWWSHDIGGHMNGTRDDELYLRWVQFGVFSPIMRLHSCSNEFSGKEPWKYKREICDTTIKYLRLRHRLIPYIYSMNYRNHTEGIALCEPMYYTYPQKKNAYRCPNEYFFGSELIAAPVTEKINPKTNLAKTAVWLPKGRYTDIFNGRIYTGGRFINMYRGMEEIPVLAKAGAIIPLSQNDTENNWKNPENLEILIYRGNNTFGLYEDDGETNSYQNGASATTTFTVAETMETSATLTFTIDPAEGDVSVLPKERNYRLSFRDISACESIRIIRNGAEEELPEESIRKTAAYPDGRKYLSVCLADVKPDEKVEVILNGFCALQNQDTKEALIETISRFQSQMDMKMYRYSKFIENPTLPIPGREPYRGPIEEILALATCKGDGVLHSLIIQ